MPKNINTPIPETEIDGIGVFCYQFEIPNTLRYHRLVRDWFGMLYKGRMWDGRTGNIRDMQQIGFGIVDSLKPCEGQDVTTEIITIIEEIKSMSCNCGNCDCDAVVLPVRDESDLFGEELGDFIPPGEQPPVPEDGGYAEWGCKATRYSWDLMKEAIFGMSSFRDAGGVTVTQGEEFVRSVFARVYGGVFERLWILYSQLVYYVMQFVSVLVASRLNAWIDNNIEQLVVDVFCANSVLTAGTNVVNTIRNSSEINLIEKFVMVVWSSMYPYEGIYQSPALRLLATDHDIILATTVPDCVCAGATENPLPNLPAEYVEVPMLANAVEGVLNGGSAFFSGNRWCIIGQGNSVVTISTLRPEFNGSPVPNANIAGFHIHSVLQSIVNADGLGHNEQNTSTHISSVAFGGTPGDWLVDEKFVGAESTEASLQSWLSVEVFRREDNNAQVKDHDVENEMSWVWNGGITNAGDFNEAVIDCTWIINITGL